MAQHWQSLVANLAVVALFISAWVNGQFLFAGRPKRWRNATFGAVMGAGAIASMLLATQFEGSLLDLRQSLIAIAGFFGGPIAALVAVAMAIVHRTAIGGPTAMSAVVGIILAALVGLGVARLARGRMPDLTTAALLGGALALVGLGYSLGLSVVLATSAARSFALTLPVSLMNAAATFISALFIMRESLIERERDLLRAAFTEAPDLQYIKTPNIRFAAANKALAQSSGFASAADIIGKSDHDLVGDSRADALAAVDREIIRTGKGFSNREQMWSARDGGEMWFSTSKAPLHDGDGEIIGVVGVTRDITARKQLESQLTQSRNQLSYVLAEVSDGIAMFDAQGTLVYCNERYKGMFARTCDVRRTGLHIRDILRAVAETGEQKGIPAGDEAAWIDEIAATLSVPGEQEIELFDGSWRHIRTRPTSDGSALVVVSDVSTIKRAETALREMTERLRLLATTDGLTGLTNRRAFDQALDDEMARAERSGLPLSVLMIDVDRFKAYNDLYGHLAGDEVLRMVGNCLRGAIKRPGDVAARYGGEEFVAILPNTDEDGAFVIADALREGLHALNVPHKGSEKGVLTASIGIASLLSGTGLDGAGLLARADEALYTAKSAGRDRVTGWRPKYAVRQTGS